MDHLACNSGILDMCKDTKDGNMHVNVLNCQRFSRLFAFIRIGRLQNWFCDVLQLACRTWQSTVVMLFGPIIDYAVRWFPAPMTLPHVRHDYIKRPPPADVGGLLVLLV